MKIIKLSKGHTAKVCNCHYYLVKDKSWHYNARYAMHTKRTSPKKLNKFTHIHMSHLILGKPEKGMEIDHINRDSLDNRCLNLRFVTPRQNKLNRRWRNHPDKGVYKTPSGQWRARLKRNGVLKHLGTFNTKEEALGVVAKHANTNQW